MSEPASRGTIVITGANRGFGRYCATALQRDGWPVIATARSDAGLADLAKAGIPPVPLDLTDEASIDACVQVVRERTNGRVFALINNAATGELSQIREASTDQMLREFRTNVIGPTQLAQRFLPILEADRGRLLFVSSVLALLANPEKGVYAASKSALEKVASALRMELGNGPVRIITLRPGPIHDPDKDGAPPKPSAMAVSHETVQRYVRHALTARHPAPCYNIGLLTKAVSLASALLPPAVIEAAIRRSISK